MTIPTPEASQDPEAEQGETPLYYCISFDRLEQELNRSAATLLAERRGPQDPALSQDDPQEMLAEIAEFSAPEEDFINSYMPVQEILFRTLLARRNAPMSLEELCHELTERWSTPARPINVTTGSLQRILDSDTYYGFARCPAGD